MAIGDIGSVVSTLEFDPVRLAENTNVSLCKVAEGVVAIAYAGNNNAATIETFSVDASGNLSAVIDTLVVNAAVSCDIGRLVNYASTNVYALFYRDGISFYGIVATFTISAAGDIGAAVIDSYNFYEAGGISALSTDAIQVSGDTFAVVYTRKLSNTGYLVTLDINSDGTIDATPELDSWVFDATVGVSFSQILHVANEYYAIAYKNSGRAEGDRGRIFTTTIAAGGTLGESEVDSLVFEAVGYATRSQCFIHLDSTLFVIAYGRHDDYDGWLCSFSISAVGAISDTVLSTKEFDSTKAEWVTCVPVGTEAIAVVYKDNDLDSVIRTFPVSALGVIGDQIDSLVFDAVGHLMTCGRNTIEGRSGYFAVCARSTDNDGWAWSMDIATSDPGPTVASATPSSGNRGEAAKTETIAGTNFTGATAVSFGAGITVNDFNVDTAIQITAHITIAWDATLGLRNVSVTTPIGMGTLTDGYTVNAPTPTVTLCAPDSGNRGQSLLDVTITGTGFVGATVVSYSGTGVTVNDFSVVNSTSITGHITIDWDATLNARNITVTTPGGPGTGNNLFTVNAPAPTVTLATPDSAKRTETKNIVLAGTGFIGATVVSFGADITVNSFSVDSSIQITASITIAVGAALGARNVSVTTPGGTGTGTGIFTANEAPPTPPLGAYFAVQNIRRGFW